MAEKPKLNSPYLRSGPDVSKMMRLVFFSLVLITVNYSLRYRPGFLLRFAVCIAAGLTLEVFYLLLRDGRFSAPRASNPVTVALLVLSIPSGIGWQYCAGGIIAAVVFGKLMADNSALRVNPMLLGRLYIMLAGANAVQDWYIPAAADAVTSATPLGLLAAERFVYDPLSILIGNFSGSWEGIYAIVPGAPGEVMPVLALILGVILYFYGVIDWRAPLAFIAAFAVSCFFLGMPVLFHLAAGSLIFSAVFILTDLRSMPASGSGRLAAGALAGIINAAVRNHGYFPEGIVIAVLAVNLLSPSLDRAAFTARAIYMSRRRKKQLVNQA